MFGTVVYSIISINSHKTHLPHQGFVLPGNHFKRVLREKEIIISLSSVSHTSQPAFHKKIELCEFFHADSLLWILCEVLGRLEEMLDASKPK